MLSCKIITDAATGRSKGFGFIEMAKDEAADKVIVTVNGTTVMDRALNVSEARPQTNRGGRRGGRPGGGRSSYDRGGSSVGGRNNNSWR